MAKVIIEIEDTHDGRYKSKMTPDHMDLVRMNRDGVKLTTAQEVGILAIQTIFQASEEGSPTRKKKSRLIY